MKTREPDIIKEMKRGNMKEKWGLNFLYRIYNGRLELCVKKGDIKLFTNRKEKKT